MGIEKETLEETPQEPEQEAEATQEAEAPTNEAETLKAEIEKKEAEISRLHSLEEGYKGLQTKYNRLHDEYRRATDLRTEIEEIKENNKLYLAWLAEQGNTSEEEVEGNIKNRKADLLKVIEERESQYKQKKAQEEQNRIIKDYHERAINLGLTEDDEDYWDIGDMVVKGQLKRAEIRLKKLEGKGKEDMPKQPEPKGNTENISEEELKEFMAWKKGQLKQDTVVPSGRTSTFEEKRAAFGNGEISLKEMMEAREKEGIY